MDYKEMAINLVMHRIKYLDDRNHFDVEGCTIDCKKASVMIIELLHKLEQMEKIENSWKEDALLVSESDLLKAHDALSYEWAKEKQRADAAEKSLHKSLKDLASSYNCCMFCKHYRDREENKCKYLKMDKSCFEWTGDQQ